MDYKHLKDIGIPILEEDPRYPDFLAGYKEYACARLAEKIYLEAENLPMLVEVKAKEGGRKCVQPAYVIGAGKAMRLCQEKECLFAVGQAGMDKKDTLDINYICLEEIIDLNVVRAI